MTTSGRGFGFSKAHRPGVPTEHEAQAFRKENRAMQLAAARALPPDEVDMFMSNLEVHPEVALPHTGPRWSGTNLRSGLGEPDEFVNLNTRRPLLSHEAMLNSNARHPRV